jgi:predicted TIM-barrel fold metal-dependent hydrolase
MRIVDFHTHAFPDAIAPLAMEKLTDKAAGWDPFHDATVGGLLASMDHAGIDISVIASIATKPSQLRPILDWSKKIISGRIVPFISVHPDASDNVAILDEAKESGIKGVKIHNLYQGFDIDDPRLFPIYEAIAERDLIMLFHAGNDPAYDDCSGGGPDRIRLVHERVPELHIVAAHFGGWRIWEEVLDQLAGIDVYLEVSFTVGQIKDQLWNRIFDAHPKDRILFGSDSPWADQKAYLDLFNAVPMPDDVRGRILATNALALLGLE